MDSHDHENLEIKARCPFPNATRQAAKLLGAAVAGTLDQTDTYFAVRTGRLKLRETHNLEDDGLDAELISYDRANDPGVRLSRYDRIPVIEPQRLRQVLSAALGVACVVRKRRELLLWHNVRIHLDQVENLGNFVELEAVIGADIDKSISAQRLEQVILALRIRPEDCIATSYSDLIQLRTPT